MGPTVLSGSSPNRGTGLEVVLVPLGSNTKGARVSTPPWGQDAAGPQSLGASALLMLTIPGRNQEASVWLICKVDRSWGHQWGSHLPGAPAPELIPGILTRKEVRCSPDTQEPTCYAHIIQADFGDPACSVPDSLTEEYHNKRVMHLLSQRM